MVADTLERLSGHYWMNGSPSYLRRASRRQNWDLVSALERAARTMSWLFWVETHSSGILARFKSHSISTQGKVYLNGA